MVADLYEQQLNDVKVVPRKIFIREFARSYRPGQHVTFIGPSGRGKTKLAGELLIAVLHHISAIFVVILHGKIKDRDQTIIKLAKAAKLVIIDHFPLTRTEKLRHRDARGVVLRPLNKPGNSVREENNLLARSFKRAIHLCYHAKASKPVILFLDESHQTQVDLKLKEDCEGPLMRGRPVCGEWNLIQRGRYVSYMCYDQAEWVFIFYDPDKPNQERYSEIGGVDKYLLIELTKRLEKRTAPDGSTYSQCIAFRRSGDMLCIVDF